jgi:hypothetical protein
MESFSTVSTHNCLEQVHLSHTVTILTHEMLSNLCNRYSVLNNLKMKNLHKSRPFEWKHQSACSVVVALVVCAPLEGSLEYGCQSSEPVEESKTEPFPGEMSNFSSVCRITEAPEVPNRF